MHLGHINMYVRDADKSAEFYRHILGLHTYHTAPGRAVFLSANKEKSHEVALMQRRRRCAAAGQGPGRAEPHGLDGRLTG